MADIEIEKIRQRELRQSRNKPVKPNQSTVDIPVAGIKISATAKQKGARFKQERLPLITDISRLSGKEPTQDEASDNHEQEWSRDITRDRMKNQKQQNLNTSYDGIVDDLSDPSLDLEDSEELNELKKAIKNKSPKKIQKAGKKMATKLRERSAGAGAAIGGFIAFIVSLGLASIKDLIDFIDTFITVGLLGSVINLIVTGALALILLIQGTSLKRAGVLKKYVKRYGITAIAEFIPIISFLPLWVIAVFLARREAVKKRLKSKEVLDKMEKNLTTIKGGSPKGSR